MVRDELSVMSAFLAVADERSFTKAAAASVHQLPTWFR